MIEPQLVASVLGPLREDISALAESLSKPPPPAIRLRPGVARTEIPFDLELVPWHPQGYFLPPGVRPGASLNFAAADYYIQDASSLLAMSLVDPQPGELICDLCASPGGKSTAILEALGNAGWLLSNEAVESRLGMLQFNLARHGSVRYFVARFDPRDLADRLAASCDVVLVDAPCSGQSLLGRGKQSAAAFAPATVEHCAARQQRILNAAARLVRPGGRLIYSTCTFAFEENEGQVESFLERNANWSLEPLATLQAWQSEFGPGHYRLWPHWHGCGGAYAARLRCGMNEPPLSANDVERQTSTLRSTPWPEGFAEWGELRDSAAFRLDLQTFAWPDDVNEKLLRVAVSGPELSFRKGSTWFPSYALAMRRDPNWMPRNIMQLDDIQAAQFMQGESLRGDLRGWAVAQWQGRSLGWVKGDGTQLKNHLPKQGRIAVK